MAKRRIATIDAETDPFLFNRVPKPFAWGFWDGKRYVDFWGDDSTKALIEFLEDYPEPLLIYAHNGGRFDFMFFVEKLCGKIRIVNGRILEAQIGKHTVRDSYGILPIPLSKLGAGKMSIDYKLMERDVRNEHKQEIRTYLKADCVALYDVCEAFLEQFGDILTIGSAAMREFKKYHKFENASKGFDKFHRNYYFGGRCQCFETGIIETPIKVFDINSAYPDAMDKKMHPVGNESDTGTKITKETMFVCWRGLNFNAVPMRMPYGLDFSINEGLFWSTIHEFEAGLEMKLIVPHKIMHTVDFKKRMAFSDFVQYFYEARKIAKKTGNKFLEIFYKLILNSAYGKFAQDPEKYVDSIILSWGQIPDEEYSLEYRHDQYAIWSKPAASFAYFNVATAASITGAVRATLLHGIANSTRPLYCDTDSIFCTDMVGVKDDNNLGAWKEEAQGNVIAIAGKKMYALLDTTRPDVWSDKEQRMVDDTLIKKASKGVNLHHQAISNIARGDTVETRNDAPTFKLGQKVTFDKEGQVKESKQSLEHVFIERRVRRTGLKQKELV